MSKELMSQTEGDATSQTWDNLCIQTEVDYNLVNKVGTYPLINKKLDKKWDIYITSKYRLTKYFLITKGKNYLTVERLDHLNQVISEHH